MRIDWSPIPNCDVADLKAGDLIAWEGRALPVVYVREIPPIDWRDDEKPGQFGDREHPPAVMKLDDGTRKGLCLRIGFRSSYHRTVHRLKPHHATCGNCGELWPCTEERIDREVAMAAQEMARTCTHCGKTGGGMQMMGGEHLDIPGQMGAWFHARTKRRAKCADAADAYRVRWLARQRVIKAAEEAVRGES